MRLGDWMQTASGRQFWPMDPRAEDVHIEDIAHSLANQCRFAGHCRWFYSVAQHSVIVSHVVPAEFALWGLLHDASEAYLVDLPRPIKRASAIGDAYRIAEARIMAVICERYGLSVEEPPAIKLADNRVLMAEARDLMEAPPVPWQESAIVPWPDEIVPMDPLAARRAFLRRFAFLTEREMGSVFSEGKVYS